MSKSRFAIAWVLFILGFAAIIFGGYGLLTHSRWSDTVNSLCTIFGTMMSFSQFFVAFPSPLKLGRSQATPAAPAAPKIRSNTPPTQNYPPKPNTLYRGPQQYQPQQLQNRIMAQPYGFSSALPINTRKMYRRSGIALLLAAPCVFIEALGSFSSSSLAGILVVTIFAIPEDIFFLIAIRGLFAKQAQQAGWINIPSIVIFAAAYIVQILASIFIIVYILNFQYMQNDLNSLNFLLNLDSFFVIAAQILFGLAILRAGVYPRWTGTTLIVLGIVNTILTFISLSVPVQTPEAYILESSVVGILNFILGVLYIRWAITLFKK